MNYSVEFSTVASMWTRLETTGQRLYSTGIFDCVIYLFIY